MNTRTQTATLGGGCFWCIEAVFKSVRGVTNVRPGYAGEKTTNPTYEEVSSGTTGHTEVVQFNFDPAVISYETILRIFFGTHDPTQLNRQGNDVGTQYRSVIFYHSDEQQRVAESVMRQLHNDHIFSQPIVTALEPYTAFYEAEEYHHDYFAKNPDQPYCQAIINPKIAKLRKQYHAYLN